jgi:poly-gamma-glutamate capsule biosynthesis protein CapA/YwtB (metallophosphatase superfamily)
MKNTFAIILFLVIAALSFGNSTVNSDAPMKSGKGSFIFSGWGGDTVKVWYYLPQNAIPETPVVFVMHGVKRNGEDYCDDWIPYATRYNFFIVVPEFSEKNFTGDEGYNFGNTIDIQGNPITKEKWAFSSIEPIFDRIKKLSGNTTKTYNIYGHSAGSQFVHRFIYFVPQARINMAVSANAGWYTMPSFEEAFPYGLKNTQVSESELKKALDQKLLVLLGTEDNDPKHKHLRITPEAMTQGRHRFERGQTFYAAGNAKAAELNFPIGWKMHFAEGIGHSNKKMAKYAINVFFPKKVNSSRKILFLGDTSFGENYQRGYEKKGQGNILKDKGYNYPLQNFKPLLIQSDLVIANMETPLCKRKLTPLKGKDYLHWSSAKKAPKYLKNHNITVVSLANNHTLDHGTEGLKHTLTALKKRDIEWFGGGLTESQAAKPYVKKLQIGKDIFWLGVIGAFEYREDYDKQYNFYAKGDQGGTNTLSVNKIASQIKKLRDLHPNIFVVVFPHWGQNYVWKSDVQTELAHQLIDAGVDMVIGHGSHMLGEIEYYSGGCIIYSIGNFVFASKGRYEKLNAPPFSLIMQLELKVKEDRLQKTFKIYPTFTNNRKTNFQSRFVDENEFNKIQQLIMDKSPTGSFSALLKTGKDNFGRFLEFPLQRQRMKAEELNKEKVD